MGVLEGFQTSINVLESRVSTLEAAILEESRDLREQINQIRGTSTSGNGFKCVFDDSVCMSCTRYSKELNALKHSVNVYQSALREIVDDMSPYREDADRIAREALKNA